MTALLNQQDLASWNDLIAEAIHEPDALLSNLKVTRAHYLLSLALRQVVGAEAGANFHSWARMKYIVNLFRALHLHPDVIAAPYSTQQLDQIRDGQIPQGPL